MKLYSALLHYPAYNKNKKVIVTSITTSSIHDIARTSKTYMVEAFFFITPIERQRLLIETIIKHWKQGYGAEYNPTRGVALEVIRIAPSLEECIEEIKEREGEKPKIVVTCAKASIGITRYAELKREMELSGSSWLILFGTGWGLTQEVIEMADKVLEPIRGPVDYNHLSVRAAVAITLDRLLSD